LIFVWEQIYKKDARHKTRRYKNQEPRAKIQDKKILGFSDNQIFRCSDSQTDLFPHLPQFDRDFWSLAVEALKIFTAEA